MINKIDSDDFGKLRSWRTIREASTLFGKSVNWIHSALLPLLEPGHIRRERSKQNRLVLTISIPAAIQAVIAHAVQAAAKVEIGDPCLSGPDSPALEEYRRARAGLAMLELEERKGHLIDRAVMHEWHLRYIAGLRRAGELLQRTYGVEAQRILDDELNEIEREVLGTSADTDGPG